MKKKTVHLRDVWVSILAVLVAYVVLFAFLAAGLSPQRYDLKVGEVAPVTISATKDVEDAVATEQLREAAMRAVQPSYTSDESVKPRVLEALQEAFNQLLQIKSQSDAEDGASIATQAAAVIGEELVTQEDLDALAACDPEIFRALYEQTYALVREALTSKVTQGQEDEQAAKIEKALLGEGYEASLAAVARAVVAGTLEPNLILDEETTETNRQKAAEEVVPVYYKQGQNITNKGELVTQNQIMMLDSLGMLKDRALDMTLYAGLAILMGLLMLCIWLYLQTFAPYLLRDHQTMILLSVILVVTTGLCLLVRTISSYLMPVSLAAMLTAMLIKPRLAIVVNIVLSVVIGLMAATESGLLTSTMFSVMLTPIVAGTLCVCVIRRRPQRYTILLTGLAVSAVNAAVALSSGLITSASWTNTWNNALWAAGSGILSAVLCLGVQPALEQTFNLVTPGKLMELANPNQPLLRRLLLEAPGTYHHSIIVANLAEAAANAVGADGLLARVGSYYHDIGKLKRPMYFRENQLEDNPHDRADPRVSAAILTAHTRDGMEMGQKARLPQPILDIIRQHHGDTPVVYFYDRALRQDSETSVEDFRYDGPRPRTREAALVMMADTVEAAMRSLRETTPEKMRSLIRRLISEKINDGQLDECPLTFEDINKICDAFVTVLTGVYHERVEYPEVSVPGRTGSVEIRDKAERTRSASSAAGAPTGERNASPKAATVPPHRSAAAGKAPAEATGKSMPGAAAALKSAGEDAHGA